MPFFLDQLGREVFVSTNPSSIISVVPSQTELLHDLGLDVEVKAITKFCVHPSHWFHNKIRVGGTKQLHIEKIKSLQPDLILANKEENVKEQIEELSKDYPVWVSDVHDLASAIHMIKSVGALCKKMHQAKELADTIEDGFSIFASGYTSPIRTAYLIWKEPYMTVGGDTFIHQMLQYAGFENVFKNQTRYPVIDIAQLQAADCELLLFSSEPYPFAQKHLEELKPFLPHTKMMLVDGELFSWYGSRLLKSPAYFHQLRQYISNAYAL